MCSQQMSDDVQSVPHVLPTDQIWHQQFENAS